MFAPPRNFIKRVAIIAAFVFSQACCSTWAQNFTARYTTLDPFGATGPLPFGQALAIGDTGVGLKGGVEYGVGIDSVYDSNFFQTENDQTDELHASISPRISYLTDPEGGARVSITAAYQPVIRSYLENSELNGIDQSGNVSVIISGSRTVISAYAGYTQESGTDRLVEEFVTGSALNLGLRGTYQVAPRTSLFASGSTSISDYGESSVVGFDNNTLSLGALWAATERLSIGPSIDFSRSNSDNTGTGDSWGLSANATYSAAERIQLVASLGFQYSDYSRESQAGGFNLTGSLSANYKISELWSWSTSIQSGVIPSPTQTNFVINNWSISTSINRMLMIGSVGLGLDFSFSNYETVGAADTSLSAEENLGVLLSYQRPFFLDRVGFNTSVQYILNSGQSDWSQILLSAGLSMEF